MKQVLQQICDWVSILCPAIIAIVGVLEGSGIVQLLGDKGVWLAAGLGAVASVSSVVFNFVTGYYKKES